MIFIILFLAACYSNKQNHDTSTNTNTITIALAGDTMIGRLVHEVIQQKGYSYIWGNILPLLKQADLRLVNLETTLTRSNKAVPKVFNFKSAPQNVATLQTASIDIVSLANNHSKDFDNEGLIDTIITLQNAGIQYIGAGTNLQQARSPIIITKKDIKIGILGATDNEPTWVGTDNSPGINYFEVNKLTQLLADITTLKKQVDIVIVSLHWGPNMRERPTHPYINAAHAMINAGADIIHGHSAHIFQGIEIYKNKLILYDTGDLIDDYRIDPQLRNDWSFLFLVTVNKHAILSVQLIPLVINTMQVNIAEDPEKSLILHRMKQLSAEFGVSISNQGIIDINKKGTPIGVPLS